MAPSLPLLHHHLLPFPLPASAPSLHPPRKPLALYLCPRPVLSSSSSFALAAVNDDDEDVVLGDCLVFDDDAFEVPDLDVDLTSPPRPPWTASRPQRRPGAAAEAGASEGSSLVPERWKDAAEEINLTKKEKRRIAHGLRFGSRLDRRPRPSVAAPDEYRAYREGRLEAAELGLLRRDYVVPPLDRSRALEKLEAPQAAAAPNEHRMYCEGRLDAAELGHVARCDYMEPPTERSGALKKVEAPPPPDPATRVAPRNPRMTIGVGGLEDIAGMFSSREYVRGEMEDVKNPKSRRKLFTDEEKVLMNKRLPDLEAATSSKWLPLHTLAASGDFYLLDNLLKHNVDVNALDKDGLPAIHKAILSKKHAIINYLLRNSANPFIYDKDGATLIHYAVQTACSQTIKTLLLYNVDVNRPDDYGWTPLHLAVQTQRTDIVKLLLIKGADRTLRTQDGLTPLELCLRLGHHARTYELIKLLKSFEFRLSKQHNSV